MKRIITFMILLISTFATKAQVPTISEWEHVFYNNLTKWSNNFGGFDVEKLVLVDSQHMKNTDINIDRIYIHNRPKEWNDYINNREPFLYYSPDKSTFIDILNYADIIKKDGKYYAIFDADQSAALGTVAEHTTLDLLQFGTSSGIDEVFWLDNKRIILAGTEMDYDNRDIIKPLIFVIDFKLHYNIYIYEMPNVYFKKGKTDTSPKFKSLITDVDFEKVFENKETDNSGVEVH